MNAVANGLKWRLVSGMKGNDVRRKKVRQKRES